MNTKDSDPPIYRAYILDSHNKIKISYIFDCETDEKAIRKAQEYVNGHAVELWDRSRNIALLIPGQPTPDPRR